MRTGLSVFGILLVTTMSAAARSPLSADAPPFLQHGSTHERTAAHIDLPRADAFLYRNARTRENESLLLGSVEPRPDAVSRPSLTIGAFHAEIGGTGTKAHLVHYTLEGVQVLGGGVSGTIDGRMARLSIRWPYGE